MIKFFRKIRQQMINQNRVTKYVFYAIGEIVLVVIGILIALQVNTWNQARIENEKQIRFLESLELDINVSLELLKREDSIFEEYQSSMEKTIKAFAKIKTVEDLIAANKEAKNSWTPMRFKKATYEEMINTGSLYNIDNKELSKDILSFHEMIKTHKAIHEKITDLNSELLFGRTEIEPFLYVVREFENNEFDVGKINNSWILNPNSTTYLAVYKYYHFSLSGIIDRRTSIQVVINEGEELSSKINQELSK